MSDDDMRIDELARAAGFTVDTIRYYQREGLLPPAKVIGRNRIYSEVHLERLDRIRRLQTRRFSLAAIRALLESEHAALIDGVFRGTGTAYSIDDIVARSGADSELADGMRTADLIRDPHTFGRDAYDGDDLDAMRAIVDLHALNMPVAVLVELTRIYTEGIETMQRKVLAVVAGQSSSWDPDAFRTFDETLRNTPGALLPPIQRLVEYVHRRTLQRLTLDAIEPKPLSESALEALNELNDSDDCE
ncbi:MAG: MerR family transcriptional regulator [Acidimicrobiia bacterium]